MAKSLLLPKPRGKKKQLQNLVVLSTLLQNRVVLFPTSEPHGPLSIYLLQSLVVLPFTSELRGLLLPSELHGLLPIYFGAAWSPPSPPKPCGPPHLLWSRVVSSFLPQNLLVLPTTMEPRGLFFLWLPGLGLNPSAHLPLQPHF